MGEGKLILCVCGGGMNTSLNAKNKITDYLEEQGIHDVESKAGALRTDCRKA